MLRAVMRRAAILATLGGLAVAVLRPTAPADAPLAGRPEQPAIAAALPRAEALAAPYPPAVPVAAAVAPAGVTVELCGTGRMPLRGAGSVSGGDAFDDLPDPVGRLALQELQERLLRVLAAGDARQRVAAWLLRQPAVADPAAQAAWAAALLAEARAGGDAQALRWAVAACGHTDDAARCRRELALARVQAEPDNGLHWLEWAHEASSASEQGEAWQGVLRAHRWHEHPGGLTAVTQQALAAMQPVAPAYLRARLARETLGRDTAEAPAGQVWLEQQCGPGHADCAPLAERMAGTADSAALLTQAAVLGRQAGWAEARVQALTAATQVFHAQLPSWPEAERAVLACSGAEPPLAHVQAVARRGEVPRVR
ncbi:hypothetical protein ASD35_06665 [Pelomonas sp. Root1444]|nr:hypothetical protein ASD35_06665 [Pelomonas sp. Root1444]